MTKQPVSVNGVVRWKDVGMSDEAHAETNDVKVGVLRQEIGEVLRNVRQRQGRTLSRRPLVGAGQGAHTVEAS